MIEGKGKRNKMLTKKQRESIFKTCLAAKYSEEEDNSVVKKSEKHDSKKEIEVKNVELKAKGMTDKAANKISDPPDEKLLEKSKTVGEMPKLPDKDDVVKEIVSPVVLGQEGQPLINLQFMKKPNIVPSETPIKKKNILGKEHATASNNANTCSPTDTSKQVVLLVKGGKATSNSSKVKIPKNVIAQVSELGSTKLKPLPDASVKKSPYVTKIVPKRNMDAVTYVTPPSMKQVSKEQSKVKKMPVSKGQQEFASVASEGNSQVSKEEKDVKLDSFEKAFGGSILHNQLTRKNVDDEYNFDPEKDRESLAVLKTLINSHFVCKKDRDYENLKYELKRIRLQSYFPKGIVVKEGFDILEIISEILPGNISIHFSKMILHQKRPTCTTILVNSYGQVQCQITMLFFLLAKC